ncbi:MAG: KpsF/GutQ family sugar-phosphate isomerase [Candidatus Marinimicrobia bacterium]|nr:KpsF/GutQ family sugar-phosphate isomerase [Candidatus Neomarinimicrobiota bacterium]
MDKPADKDILRVAKGVLLQESEAVATLADRIGDEFEKAVEKLFSCDGRVVVSGMGKSGQISRKIAATLASTGTPALYIHPSEGLHGDLGMLGPADVLLVLSNSGETEDILRMLPTVEVMKVPVIALLGRVDSRIGRKADIVLDASVEREACPMDLAPTTSTTAALALGDALAMALLELRDFAIEDYALLHPGGSLGKRLLTTVASLMHDGDRLPLVREDEQMHQVILLISEKGLGITGVVNPEGSLIGAITDGDLRRGLEANPELLNLKARDVMTPSPKRIQSDSLAVTALAQMEDHAITSLFVMRSGDDIQPEGLIHIHDILRSGIHR